MTTEAPTVDSPDGPGQEPESRSWGDIAVSFAGRIARLADIRRGDVAKLRRMDPDAPDVAVFWELMALEEQLGNPAWESKWALILHGMALMTPRNSGDGNPLSAHDGSNHVGRALFLGGEASRERAFYSEQRLNRLLTAQGDMLRVLLARMFRTLASAGVTFNWREMAQFILNEGYDEEAAERARHRVAREYYRAARRGSQDSED